MPQVNVSKNKFHIKLKIPGPDMTEIELGCNSDVQYGKWMAACRLAAKGKTMADPTYDVEVAGIKTFISMQRDTKDETDSPAVDNASIQCEDFVPQRLLSRMKSKQVGFYLYPCRHRIPIYVGPLALVDPVCIFDSRLLELIHTLSKFHCLINELYPATHHSFQEHAIYGTSCLLLPFPNPITCYLSKLT